jgi:hypothetical protein
VKLQLYTSANPNRVWITTKYTKGIGGEDVDDDVVVG